MCSSDLVRHGLLQPRMARDPVAAAIHAAVMWGFVILSIGTLDRVGLGAPGRLLALPMDGGLWHAILALQSLMAILVLGAIAGAVARRLVTRPARLTLSRDGVVILALIATIVVTETLAEAFRIVAAPGPADAWAWLPSGLAVLLAPIGPSVAGVVAGGLFWLNQIGRAHV